MGVEIPITPVTMSAAAPKGAPRRIKDGITKNLFAPPCLGDALRRGTLTMFMDIRVQV